MSRTSPTLAVQHIAAAFDLGGRVLDVRPHGHGLINDTFLVTTDSGRHAVLQRLNRRVFRQPELIFANLRTLTEHIRRRQRQEPRGTRELRLPEIFSTHEGLDYAIDAEGSFWRALGFIENTRSFPTIVNEAQAAETGYALGRFHALVHDLAPSRLHETLPGFHVTPGYLIRFDGAAARPRDTHFDAELRHCLAFVEAHRDFVPVLETAKREGRLPLRPVHGDPKLDNFLFDAATGRVVSLIDLDTVQPGLIHYDIGDCLRSCCNRAGESPADASGVRFDFDACRTILEHYLAEARGFLRPHDWDHLYDAIRLIPLELGLRFLTDHIEGNCYFKIDRPGQNLRRALVQFRLVEQIEAAEGAIRTLLTKLQRGGTTDGHR